jgi:hypothetical protein
MSITTNIEQYQKVTRTNKNILDLLALPGVENIEFTPPRMQNKTFEPADLSGNANFQTTGVKLLNPWLHPTS